MPGNGILDGSGVSPYGAHADHTHEELSALLHVYAVVIKAEDWDSDTKKAVKEIDGLKVGYAKMEAAAGSATEVETDVITVEIAAGKATFTCTTVPLVDVSVYLLNG